MHSYLIEPPDSWWQDDEDEAQAAQEMETERRIDELLEENNE